MPVLSLDFETRSKLDIGLVGMARYAESCTPLMVAYGNKTDQRQWYLKRDGTDCPAVLAEQARRPDVLFTAFNAPFEMYVWAECVKRWGWPAVPLRRWRCSAARARAANQPGGLANLVKRLQLPEDAKKDARGKYLIKALSCPTKVQKTYLKTRLGPDGKSVKDANGRVIRDVNPLSEQYLKENGIEVFELENPKTGKVYRYHFREDSKLMDEYLRYNLQDIVAELSAAERLPTLPDDEQELWFLDREINTRGIPVDLDLCRGASVVYEAAINDAHARMNEVTEGWVDKCTQAAALVSWLNERLDWEFLAGNSLAKPIIPKFLEVYKGHPQLWAELPWKVPDVCIPDEMNKVLEALFLRDFAGGTAVSKYKSATIQASNDGRVREQLLAYGAATARWTGKGLQPHNMKREATLPESYIDALKTGNKDIVDLVGEVDGLTTFDILSGCVRGSICAPPGKVLIRSDFAGIESRVLNWLVGNEYKLDLFRKNEDTYIHAACPVFDVNFEDITIWDEAAGKAVIHPDHKAKRQIGKVCELALGYGMGGATFRKHALQAGNEITEIFAAEVVKKWRAASPAIPQFWWDVERAFRDVIGREMMRRKFAKRKTQPPRLMVDVAKVKVGWHPRNYCCVRLPSQRLLYYYHATLAKDKRPDADPDDGAKIFYLDGTKTGARANGLKIETYSGKICENIVQAIARDLLVHSMKIIAAAGLRIVFHVHDEVVVEVDEGDVERAFAIIHKAMETLPDWAAGLPLKAETAYSRRYTK